MARRSACGLRGVVALLLLSSPAGAHDLWILPGKYRLDADEVTRVFINSGDAFPESLTLTGAHRVIDLRALGPEGEAPLSGFRVDSKSLTFEFRSKASGSYVVALATRPRTVRMKASDFEDYLAEEGLSAVAEMRRERSESEKPAVERYAKWAKAVLEVGDGAGPERWSESVGHPFEIVPLANPDRIAPGGALRLKVLRDGEPLEGVGITGARAGGPARELVARTDTSGEAEVRVSAPGRWYVRALHMIRIEGDPEVEWESYWATLTFEVLAPGAGAP
jgi:uncharacterized GH25 family protein